MRKKIKLSITMPPELLEWLDSKVEERIFADRSHGFERAVICLKSELEKERRDQEKS